MPSSLSTGVGFIQRSPASGPAQFLWRVSSSNDKYGIWDNNLVQKVRSFIRKYPREVFFMLIEQRIAVIGGTGGIEQRTTFVGLTSRASRRRVLKSSRCGSQPH